MEKMGEGARALPRNNEGSLPLVESRTRAGSRLNIQHLRRGLILVPFPADGGSAHIRTFLTEKATGLPILKG
jgi:hypothetical protein